MKAFIDAARGWLGRREPLQAPRESRDKFLLRYGPLIIGTLSLDEGVWKFEYSEEFKRKRPLRPIVEFPDIDRIYLSGDLWQFFASRIPSSEQPEIEEILKKENISEHDSVGLLKRFGRRTISNPFHLEAA